MCVLKLNYHLNCRIQLKKHPISNQNVNEFLGLLH